MSQKVSGGVGAVIVAVIIIVIGIIAWTQFGPKHGTPPPNPTQGGYTQPGGGAQGGGGAAAMEAKMGAARGHR